ncbi:MAG: hypothetical protein INQ03_16775 [Candidatus Heimdallarchaeota archaeon]|nr:hypothetical protein [Candidatus Heimdallarchaeota archaeon]
MGKEFDSLADQRNRLATTISDEAISKTVIEKILILDADLDMKASILMQAITDIGVIFRGLQYFNQENKINNQEYHDLLEICIHKYHFNEEEVDFNPLHYHSEDL